MTSNTKVKLISGENILRQIREALGMSQREFAKNIGTTQNSIYRWETGKANPPLFTISQMKAIQKLIRQIGLDLEDLPDNLIS